MENSKGKYSLGKTRHSWFFNNWEVFYGLDISVTDEGQL